MSWSDSTSSSESEEESGPPYKKWKSVRLFYPGFSLLDKGADALLEHVMLPLTFRDITGVIEYFHLGSINTPVYPSWINTLSLNKIRHSVVIFAEGNFTNFTTDGKFIKSHLQCGLSTFKSILIEKEIAETVLLISETRNIIEEYGSTHRAYLSNKESSKSLHGLFEMTENDIESERPPGEVISRNSIALNDQELLNCGYPVPLRNPDFTNLHDVYMDTTADSPLLGLDIEGGIFPCRVSVCDEDGEKLYDTFVSGTGYSENSFRKRFRFEAQHKKKKFDELLANQKSLDEVRSELKSVIPPDCYLVGHDLKHDHRGLRILFPHVIDTSQIYNTRCERGRKQSLEYLCTQYAPLETPNHIPLNDAKASVSLVKRKLQEGFDFGNTHLRTSGHVVAKGYDFGNTHPGTSRSNVVAEGQSRILGNEGRITKLVDIMNNIRNSNGPYENVRFQAIRSDEEILLNPSDELTVAFLDDVNVENLDIIVNNFWDLAANSTAFFVVNVDPSKQWDCVYFGIKTEEPHTEGSAAKLERKTDKKSDESRKETKEEPKTESKNTEEASDDTESPESKTEGGKDNENKTDISPPEKKRQCSVM